MRKIKGTIVLKYAEVGFEFEVPDDATDEEITKICQDYAMEYVYCTWKED